ncbi:hypothetical protein ACFU7Z_29225 [Kitasatospora sp. NPDC057518]|uniref:hypothetical protein n=1 Tax=Kitasatospora sp. NPDC057518 TaxID=3346155 RepID=UPI003684639B
MSESPELNPEPKPKREPDHCPRDGEVLTVIRPEQDDETDAGPPGQDALDEWTCPKGHFGYFLPAEHLEAHPYDDRIQVCGTKRHTDPLAVSVVA